MAQEFQPQLSDPQIQKPTSGRISNVDISGIGRNIQTIFNNTKVKRQAEQDAVDSSSFANFALGTIDLKNERASASLLQDQIIADAMQLRADGIITDDESNDLLKFNKNLNRLKEVQKGVSDPRVFNTRMRGLIGAAIKDNPRLAGHLKALFTGESLFKDNTEDSSKRARAQLSVQMDRMYGTNNWGTAEVAKFGREEQVMLRTGEDISTLSARQLSAQIPFKVSTNFSSLTTTWATQARANGGFLSPNQMENAKAELLAESVRTRDFFNTEVAKRGIQDFNPLSLADQKSLKDQLDGELANISAMLDSKDFLAAVDLHNTIRDASAKFNQPAILVHMKSMVSSGVQSGDINAIIDLLDDETFMRVSKALDLDPLLHASGLDKETVVTAIIDSWSKPVTPQDEFSKRRKRGIEDALSGKIATYLTKKGAGLPRQEDAMNEALKKDGLTVEQLTAGELPESIAIFVADMEDSLLVLRNPEFAAQHALNMEGKPKAKAAFSQMATNWLTTTVSLSDPKVISIAMAGEHRPTIWDPSINRFVINTKKYRPLTRTNRFAIRSTFPEEIRLFNGLLTLADNKSFTGLTPTVEDVIRQLTILTEKDSASIRKEESKASEEAEVKASKRKAKEEEISFSKALSKEKFK